MAAEALKKWDGWRSARGGCLTHPQLWGSGDVTPRNFFENIGANLCNLEHFGASGHQKWDGKSTLFRPTFKSGTGITVPAV